MKLSLACVRGEERFAHSSHLLSDRPVWVGSLKCWTFLAICGLPPFTRFSILKLASLPISPILSKLHILIGPCREKQLDTFLQEWLLVPSSWAYAFCNTVYFFRLRFSLSTSQSFPDIFFYFFSFFQYHRLYLFGFTNKKRAECYLDMS